MNTFSETNQESFDKESHLAAFRRRSPEDVGDRPCWSGSASVWVSAGAGHSIFVWPGDVARGNRNPPYRCNPMTPWFVADVFDNRIMDQIVREMAASAVMVTPLLAPRLAQDAATVPVEDTPNLFSHMDLITRSDVERLEGASGFKVDRDKDYMSLKDLEADS